jgi:hypothetical protein
VYVQLTLPAGADAGAAAEVVGREVVGAEAAGAEVAAADPEPDDVDPQALTAKIAAATVRPATAERPDRWVRWWNRRSWERDTGFLGLSDGQHEA